MHRWLTHRFKQSPGKDVAHERFDDLMKDMGYDAQFDSRDFARGQSGTQPS